MMTRDEVRAIRDTLDQFVKTLEVPGYRFRLGNGTFGETATFKIEVLPVGKNGEVKTKEAAAFAQLARLYGFLPDDLGKEFEHGGRVFKIAGLNTKARKGPVLCTRDDGKVFKFPTELAKKCLGATTV
jgi:hypothetical protein